MKTRRKREEEDGISGLSNQFVHCLIEKLELTNYHGVLSADKIKAESLPVNSIYLVNTNPSYRPGEHFPPLQDEERRNEFLRPPGSKN